MSAQLAALAASPAAGGGSKKPLLERKFSDLVDRLMKEDGLDLAAVQAFMREWLHENVNRLAPEERLKVYEDSSAT